MNFQNEWYFVTYHITMHHAAVKNEMSLALGHLCAHIGFEIRALAV